MSAEKMALVAGVDTYKQYSDTFPVLGEIVMVTVWYGTMRSE